MTVPNRGKKRVREGTVVSDKMQNTIVVDVERVFRHSLYGKVVRRSSRCYVHDEKGEARVGNKVRIVECKPLSKLKRWRLLEVLRRRGDAEDTTVLALSDDVKEVVATPEQKEKKS